jgi:hypothetical protein
VSLDELYPIDVYPVGLCASVLRLYGSLAEVLRPQWLTPADARGHFVDTARRAARDARSNWRKPWYWHGFHAEPNDTRWMIGDVDCGRGWTQARARHDLARRIIAAMGARYGALRPANSANTAALAASIAAAWRREIDGDQ